MMLGKQKIFDSGSVEGFLRELGGKLESRLSMYMIGGGAMCLKNLKDATFDIDIVVMSRKGFDALHKAIVQLGYVAADKELLKEAIYRSAVVVFERGPSRIDVLIRRVSGMLDFSERMKERAQLYRKEGNLVVYLASNTDILLLKSLSDRDAYSDRFRHLIPIDSATLFRSNPPPDSEALRHP